MPALGDSAHGFPYLSGVGRLVIKDAIMLGAAVVTLADAAKTSLQKQKMKLWAEMHLIRLYAFKTRRI
jgi:reactive chlorine resistance protein C